MCDYWIEEFNYIKESLVNLFYNSINSFYNGFIYIVNKSDYYIKKIYYEEDENYNYMLEILKKKKDWLKLKEEYENEEVIDILNINNENNLDDVIANGYVPIYDEKNHLNRFYIKIIKEIDKDEYNKYLKNLDLISKINENQKLSINGETIEIVDGYLNGFYRYYNNQNRNTNYIFLKDFYNKLLEYLNEIKFYEDEYNKLKSEILNSINGLEKIIITYKDDEKYKNKINLIINKLKKL